jgi:hypothetical protein
MGRMDRFRACITPMAGARQRIALRLLKSASLG